MGELNTKHKHTHGPLYEAGREAYASGQKRDTRIGAEWLRGWDDERAALCVDIEELIADWKEA